MWWVIHPEDLYDTGLIKLPGYFKIIAHGFIIQWKALLGQGQKTKFLFMDVFPVPDT